MGPPYTSPRWEHFSFPRHAKAFSKFLRPRPIHTTFMVSFAGTLAALFLYSPFAPHNTVPTSKLYLSANPLAQHQVVQHRPVQGRAVHTSSLASTTKKFCDGFTTCIFDLGFNTGQDTDMYLKDSNARVLAVEANPVLVDTASAKEPFKSAIASARLKILPVGISKIIGGGNLTFWINDYSEYSSFVEEMGCRKVGHGQMPEGDHTHCRSTNVPTITCSQLLDEYGTPKYMKIDIEGLQMACLDSLAEVDVKYRPPYISTEGADVHGVRRYLALGYSWFKIVNQKDTQLKAESMYGASGPRGENAQDVFVGKRWQNVEETLENLPLNETMAKRGWFDLHARKNIV